MNACLLFLATTVSLHVLSILKVTGNDRYHQPGDVTLGGLFLLHYTTEDGQCGKFFPIGLGHVEAMIFAIHKINSDPFLLPNITLGFEIRDYCESAAKAMEHTYDFVRLNEILTEAQNASCKHTNKKNITQSEEKPITAVVGPTDSGSAVLVASLLRVGGVPVISHSATSNELSSPLYRHFFRTAPPDGQQASAMADLIEHFNWSYVAAVAMDDSYGRNGVWKLESEADYRKTFCLSFAEYIPRQEYIAKLKRGVSKLKSHPNIRVVVLWLFGGYGRRFLKEAVQQNLVDRTWILSDALATEDDVFVGLKRTDQKILHGSLGLQPRMLDNKDFEKFLVNESLRLLNVKQVPWWQEFWKSEDSRHCSSLTVLSEQKYCIQIVLRTIYDTYIPYVVDAVYAIAHALHELINNCSRLGCEKSTKTGSGVFPFLSSRYVEDFLRNVNFTGMTGQVRFDKFGDPLGSSYDIVHFKTNDTSNSQDPVKLVIGSWEKNRKNKLQLNSNNIRWNTISSQGFVPKSFCHEDCPTGTFTSVTTPCCWKCLRCPTGTISSQINDMNCTECPQGQTPNESRSECLDLPEIEIKWSSLASVLVILFAIHRINEESYRQLKKHRQINRKEQFIRMERQKVQFKCLECFAGLFSNSRTDNQLKRRTEMAVFVQCTFHAPMMLVLEYAPYGDVLGYLRKSRGVEDQFYCSPECCQQEVTSYDLLSFAQQIASGMRFLTSKKILHRDLPARNVLLGAGRICKICDFGLALIRERYQQYLYCTAIRKGRLPIKWTAPEHLFNVSDEKNLRVSEKSDVWSYGIVLFEIFTLGGVPYPGWNEWKVVYELKVNKYRMPQPEHVSEELYQLMVDCWNEDPDARPTFDLLHEVTTGYLQEEHYVDMSKYEPSLYANVEETASPAGPASFENLTTVL
ncbi:Metabotropic glutamate receptor 7 [Stylophora pistillata]|uniref:Metabotropic glutamate receptor 7 n=1 Tax=Stylophora pistillata TaxID=50429 RepID=A0A2B4RYP0_STYPI|nr:Metabotropic glutamate receptor 7 [Stylophora pistillata]